MMNDLELIDEIVKRADEYQKQKERDYAAAELKKIRAEIENIRDVEVTDGTVYVSSDDVYEIIGNHIKELNGENKDCIDCNNNCDNGCCKKGCIGYCEGKYWTPKVELKGENK